MENQKELQADIQDEIDEETFSDNSSDSDTYHADDDGSASKIQLTDLQRKKKHSRGMMDVSKRLYAKYIITNKCICIFFILVHLIMAILSAIGYSGSSFVQSEGLVCRLIYPLNHFVYFVLNILLMFLYAGSLISSNTTETGYYENVRVFGLVLGMFSVYTIGLKFLSDSACEFWTLQWSSVLSHTAQFGAEGLFIYFFFNWYFDKIKLLKETMLKSAQYLV